jgi:heme-degrading monooxygenase HmoA
MIVRVWTGEALEENAEDFRRHFAETYMPRLRSVAGFRGVEVLERVHRGYVEFVVLTRWDTMDAIHEITGHINPDHCFIEADCKKLLERHDEKVKHYVLVAEEGR